MFIALLKKCFMSALLACASLIPVAAFAAMSCESLSSLNLPDATVTLAQKVTGGTFTPPNGPAVTDLPAFCRVTITVEPQIKIEVWLPDAWNQRFRAQGGGGYAGSISYDARAFSSGLGVALRAGYATANTDTGHSTPGGSFALNADGTLNWQLIEDFASRSNHEMTKKAKAVIQAYYGTAPTYSYWHGCSTGGRQGLMEAQRFPQDYDGLLIGAPAINWDRFIPGMLWGNIVMQQELGGSISAAKLAAVSNDAITACDAADGITDGVINDPRKCDYDPAASVCKAGDDPTKCLTPQEANAVRKIWNGPTDAKGRRLWFFYERGASLAALPNLSHYSIPADWFSYWLKQDPKFDWRTVRESDFERYFRLSQRKFNEVIGTDESNLQPLRKHGGKMIIWHGEMDARIMPRGTLNYFERVLEDNGGIKHVDSFARLYMAPGIGHCGTGPGPDSFVGRDDLFKAVVNWVENGVAPERIIASRPLPNGTVRSRPLCPYPTTAKWTGTGSTNDAANFVCVDGNHDPNDFKVFGRGADNEGLGGDRKDDDD
jgi:hypothetical protein